MLPLNVNSTQHQSACNQNTVSRGFFWCHLRTGTRTWAGVTQKGFLSFSITVSWRRLRFYLPQLVEQQPSNVYSFKYKAGEVLLHPVQGRKTNTCFRLQKKGVRFAEYSGTLPNSSGDATQNQASRVVLHSLHWGLSNHFKETPVRGNLNITILSRTDDDLDGHMEVLPEQTKLFWLSSSGSCQGCLIGQRGHFPIACVV